MRAFARAAGVEVETRDISLAGRIVSQFPDVVDPALQISDDAWRRYFETTVLTAVRLTRAYLPGAQDDRLLASLPEDRRATLLARADRHGLVFDIRLQGERDGISAAAEIRQHFGLPIVYITAYADPQTRARAAATGPSGFVSKPFSAEILKRAVDQALADRLRP